MHAPDTVRDRQLDWATIPCLTIALLGASCGDDSHSGSPQRTASTQTPLSSSASTTSVELESTLHFRAIDGQYKAIVSIGTAANIGEFTGAFYRLGWSSHRIVSAPIHVDDASKSTALISLNEIPSDAVYLVEIQEPQFSSGIRAVTLYFRLKDGRKAFTKITLYFSTAASWKVDPLLDADESDIVPGQMVDPLPNHP